MSCGKRLRAARAVALVVPAFLLGSCKYLEYLPFLKRPVDTAPGGRSSTERGPAYGSRDGVRRALSGANDWASYNGDFTTAQRFSPLTGISAANVGSLAPVCTAELGEQTAMQSGPVIVDGVMYLTSAVNTWALDASTCALRWRHSYAYRPKPDYDLKTNRGVAFVDTPDGVRLVRGANDGRVYALDARTGDEVWNVREGDVARGETFPAAPIAWGGLVYIGNAGGDNYGVTGRMMALDARTGAEVWRAELIPRAGPSAFTWPAETDHVPRGGATTWTSYTLDTLRGELYVPTGNAAPDFLASVRPGANDYTYSIVVLDARSGAFRRAYKLLINDVHDWDVAAAPMLLTPTGGKSMIVAAGKDGYVYGVDRDGGEMLYKTPVTTIENATAPLTPQGTRFCPGVQGGVEWNGPAYSPLTNALYVNAIDWCTTVQVAPAEKLKGKRAIPWTGSAKLTQPFGKMDPKDRAHGWLTALDATTGVVRWRYRASTPLVAGITTTAGGLVFTADLAGNVFAFNATDGRELWQRNLGQPIGGGVVTYLSGGRQLLAVASGLNAPATWQTKSSPARVTIFGLPGGAR